LEYLSELPLAGIATHEEVLQFIERRGLFGRGIGLAAELTFGASLWTYDKRLHRAADYLGIAMAPHA
jgi:hypothetical protein